MTDPVREAFRPFFQVLVKHEGVLSTDRRDPGNWTSGRVNVGEFRGTKYGISAASYPHLDIARLTLEQAFEIYFRDYWLRCGCEAMPPLLRMLVFDAAVNNGAGNAARFLQRALGVADDGKVGAITRAALAKASTLRLAESFMRERATFMSRLSIWPDQGRGWCIRLATLPFQAMDLTDGALDGMAEAIS